MCSLKIDLHVHSRYSIDSFTPVDKILKFAEKIGLDGIAITDHDSIKGGLVARKIKGIDIRVIIGSEITLTNGGEVLGLFLNEEVKSGNFLEVCDQIHDQDGLVVLPHPFRASKNTIEKITVDELSKIKIIESLNAFNYSSENEKAIKFSKDNSLTMIAGSDAHYYSTIGRAYTIFTGDAENLRKELLRGNVDIAGKSINKNDRARIFLNRELKSKNYRGILRYYSQNIFRRFK